MKKEKKVFVLSLVLLILISSNLVLVSAQNFLEDVVFQSEVYKTIRPYFVPEVEYQDVTYGIAPGIGEATLFIIGFISLIILFTVVYDILTLIPVFSIATMRIIAIGLGIIMILLKWNVFFAAWLFSWGIAIFAGAGSIAVFLVLMLGILILIGLFVGGNWFIDYMNRIRDAREAAEGMSRGRRAGGRIRALEEEARAAGRR